MAAAVPVRDNPVRKVGSLWRPPGPRARQSWQQLTLLAGGLLLALLSSPLAAALPMGAPAAAGAPAEDTVLEPGAELARSSAGGQVDGYSLDLTAGNFARIEIEQHGVDIAVVVLSPQGATLIEVDGPSGDRGTETVSLLAPDSQSAGAYRLEIRNPYPEATAGNYTLRYVQRRPAEASDLHRLAAERAFAAALTQWGSGDIDAAVAGIGTALTLWETTGETRQLAAAWTALGSIHRRRGEVSRETECWERALPLWSELAEARREAEILNNLGTAYGRSGRTAEALEHSQRAAHLFAAQGNPRGEAAALNNLGSVLRQTGDLASAIARFEASLELRRQTHDRRGEARTLNNLGLTRTHLGEMREAIADYQTARTLARQIGDRRTEVAALNNLSVAYDALGELQSSLESYREVLRYNREAGDLRAQAIALSNLGTLHKRLGESESAIDYYLQAVELAQEAGDRFVEATALDNIGWVRLALEQPAQALPYAERALELAREIDFQSREIVARMHLARAQDGVGEHAAALASARQAVTQAKTTHSPELESFAQLTLGLLVRLQGGASEAIAPLRRALALNRQLGSRSGEAQSLHELALASRDRGDLETATRLAEQAVELVESLRSEVAVQDLRATFLASNLRFYEVWIDLLMARHRSEPQAGWKRRALAVAERGRARSLLESLSEVRSEILRGVDPELRAEERRLRDRLNARERDRQELVAAARAEERPSVEDAARTLQREIRELTEEYRALESRIRLASPRFAELTQPQPLSIDQIQRQVLDSDSLLLQYSFGTESSYLWTVSASSVEAFELPPRDQIEAQAREVYALLTARNLRPEGEAASTRAARIAAADAAFPAAAGTLSRTVLGPAIDRLGDRRLVVVADGALQYIPFAALPRPGGDEPLLVRHEVVNLPSASTLAVLRREVSSRPEPPGLLAVLADPVFDAEDPRVSAARRATDRSQAASERIAGLSSTPGDGAELRSGGYRRLRFSRSEAEAIASLVPAEAQLKALDFAASLDTATSGDLGSYRLVHLATHGVLNSDYPALSGLVLSLVDEAGEPRNGFLRLHDIYNLELRADLVTLSACETALGRDIRGEGLVGLARGFMYAGSARVVASLWSVQDRATSKVMRGFYSGMLTEQLRPAAALRSAQLELHASERWRSPYYWAGFVLHGEWR